MTDDLASIGPTLRAKVSTGYARLDEDLQGGFLTGSAIVLSAPASDEVPLLLRNFLMPDKGEGLLLSRSLSASQAVSQLESDNLNCLICSEKPVPPSKNVMAGKGIENLTELNFQITETISSTQPKRVAIDILSDILLRHKALQTRKWLSELLERLRSKGITTLTVLNPYMHSNEDVQAVVDVFDGNLEVMEKDVEGTLRKFLRINWMHGVEVAEKEFMLVDLAPEPQTLAQPVTVQAAPLKEPRWLTPLIARTEELSRLRSRFDSALVGRSTVVALRGEAGVGKSRLMHELAAYAQTRSGAILFGRASENGLPYAPWVDVARQYVSATPGEVLRRMLGPGVSELVKLVPDIAAKLGTIPPSRSLGEQQDKVRFYEAVTQFFIAVSSQTPLLLLFEDMQYADPPSLDLLEYFVRSTSNLRVLTVCASPPEQATEANSLKQFFLKLNRERLLENVNVKNLSKPETIELMKATFGEQTISPEFADLIYYHTAGNPFFVEEVLRSLVEDGTIYRTEKGWDRKPIQDIKIPETVKTALKSRLTKLDQETLNVLSMAAVIGTDFDFKVLQEITSVQEETLLERIEKALSSGLVLEDEHRQGVLTFADSRVREILLDDLSKLRRTGYHLKIAQAIEKYSAQNLETQSEAIAEHYSQAGKKELALKYSIMAGDRNRSIHAYEQAIRDYKHAAELITLEQGKDGEKAVILEKLAGCFNLAGKPQDSAHHYQEAIALFEKLHDFKACARISVDLSWALFRAKPTGVQDAVALLRQALKYVKGDPESYEAAGIYSGLANRLSSLFEIDEANSWLEKAREAGEKSGNFTAIVEALATNGFCLCDTGRFDEGLPLQEKALDLAMQHEIHYWQTNILGNLSIYIYARDIAKGRELASRYLELAKRQNAITAEAAAYAWLAYLDWLKGDWAAAVDEVNRALEMAERLGFTSDFVMEGEVARGLILLSLGDLDQAEKYLENSKVKQSPRMDNIVSVNLIFGKVRLEQGREDEAKAYFEICVNTFRESEFGPLPPRQVETLLHLASIYARRGELGEARKMSEWARRLAEALKSDAGLAMASQAEATLLHASGDSKVGEEAYLKSLALWEKAGWPYYHAKALVAYSEAIAQTNTDESKKRLEQAAEIFKKLGAKRDLERAEAKLSAK